MTNNETNNPGAEGQIPRAKPSFVFGVILSFLLIAAAFLGATLVIHWSHGVWWAQIVFFIPLLVLLATQTLNQLLVSESGLPMHGSVQVIILIITIGSFYAFGWPADRKFDDPHTFSELSIILVLFLLAELAAYLTLSSAKISGELDTSARTAVEGIKRETNPIREELSKLTKTLEAGKIAEAVTVLGGIVKVGQAVKDLSSVEAQNMVLTKVSDYTKSWATFLQSAWRPTEPNGDLRFECCKRLFTTYLDAESNDFPRDGGHPKELGDREIVTDDSLYFKILQQMLLAHRDVNSVSEQVFAWAITNVSPYGFYHWGQLYGYRGAHPFMDEFRNTVLNLLKDRNQTQLYQRLFLFDENIEHTDESVTGIYLSPSGVMPALAKKILLRVSDTDKADDDIDRPRSIRVWKELNVWNAMQLQGARNHFYGIVDERYLTSDTTECKTVFGSLPPWEIGKTTKVQRSDIVNDYYVTPVKFLDNFEMKYQSPDGMFCLAIRDADLLPDILRRNPDCLILGTMHKAGGTTEYHPVIAISSNVVANSDTMRMRVFTCENHLQQLHQFWNQAKERRKKPSDFVRLVQAKACPPETFVG